MDYTQEVREEFQREYVIKKRNKQGWCVSLWKERRIFVVFCMYLLFVSSMSGNIVM